MTAGDDDDDDGAAAELERLRDELLARAAEDARVRAELVEEGTLFDGYHPRMEAVHRDNAAFLAAAMERPAVGGWPSVRLVGAEASDAAWLIAQHAIGEPAFQRRCLAALEAASEGGDVPRWQPAMLEDRIRVFEGGLQRYGTQLEVAADGTLVPHAIEDPEGLEARRAAVGLEPLAARLAREERVPAPADPDAYRRGYLEWLHRTGWRR